MTKTKIATKLIELRLSAMTRIEYMEVVSVPSDITDDELNKLIDRRYDDVDMGLYSQDPDYLERSRSCYAIDSDMPNAKASLIFRRENGTFKVDQVEDQEKTPVMNARVILGASHAYACLKTSSRVMDVRLASGRSAEQSLREYAQELRVKANASLERADFIIRGAEELERQKAMEQAHFLANQ